MSGLYLIVWDNHKQFDRVLKPTKGGWPHITVAYTGRNASVVELKQFSMKMFDEWVMRKVILNKAYVNSFQYDSGEWRHDCLLQTDDDTINKINDTRNLVKSTFSNAAEKFSMHNPHVTAGIFSNLKEAQEHVDKMNEILPITVTVTGVTID